jgi:hypothetical protein
MSRSAGNATCCSTLLARCPLRNEPALRRRRIRKSSAGRCVSTARYVRRPHAPGQRQGIVGARVVRLLRATRHSRDGCRLRLPPDRLRYLRTAVRSGYASPSCEAGPALYRRCAARRLSCAWGVTPTFSSLHFAPHGVVDRHRDSVQPRQIPRPRLRSPSPTLRLRCGR